MDKRVLMGMAMELRKSGIDARENDVRRYVQSNLIPEFDPVGEYIWAQRGKWDGKDHIRELARRVPTKNPHWEDWFYTARAELRLHGQPAVRRQESGAATDGADAAHQPR